MTQTGRRRHLHIPYRTPAAGHTPYSQTQSVNKGPGVLVIVHDPVVLHEPGDAERRE
jgi:hypothetical protein